MVCFAVIYVLMNALKHSGFEKAHLLHGVGILLVGLVALAHRKLKYGRTGKCFFLN